eukprot:CAMPEP_0114287608 /NCGR_PEP_ID=MMETSP0059-20121206/6368_1 /TAXON_ID=36894 /ORGANISM="Pyramimonas parkeae, Strain CCMP726" /LENGTH=1091 /DNA_ID=CAMNT_0001408699 /DNA_START=1 /DNA_END=3276 /DNA_ORIENTATION=-
MTGLVLFGDQSEHFSTLQAASNSIFSFVLVGAPDGLEDMFEVLREQEGLLGLGAWFYFVCMLAWSLFLTNNILFAVLGDAHVDLLRTRPPNLQNLIWDMLQIPSKGKQLRAGEKLLSVMQRAYVEDLSSQSLDAEATPCRPFDDRIASKQFNLLLSMMERQPSKLYKNSFVLVQTDVQEAMHTDDKQAELRRIQSLHRLPSEAACLVQEYGRKSTIRQRKSWLANKKMKLDDAELLLDTLKCDELSIMEGLDTLDPKGFQNASHEERRMSISVTKKIIQHYLNDHSHHQLDLPHRSSRFEKSAQGQKVLKSSLAAVRALTRKQRCMQEDFRATQEKMHTFLDNNIAAHSKMNDNCRQPASMGVPSSSSKAASQHSGLNGSQSHDWLPRPQSHIWEVPDLRSTSMSACLSKDSTGNDMKHWLSEVRLHSCVLKKDFDGGVFENPQEQWRHQGIVAETLESSTPKSELRDAPLSGSEAPGLENKEPLSPAEALKLKQARVAKGKAKAVSPDTVVPQRLQSQEHKYLKQGETIPATPGASTSGARASQQTETLVLSTLVSTQSDSAGCPVSGQINHPYDPVTPPAPETAAALSHANGVSASSAADKSASTNSDALDVSLGDRTENTGEDSTFSHTGGTGESSKALSEHDKALVGSVSRGYQLVKHAREVSHGSKEAVLPSDFSGDPKYIEPVPENVNLTENTSPANILHASLHSGGVQLHSDQCKDKECKARKSDDSRDIVSCDQEPCFSEASSTNKISQTARHLGFWEGVALPVLSRARLEDEIEENWDTGDPDGPDLHRLRRSTACCCMSPVQEDSPSAQKRQSFRDCASEAPDARMMQRVRRKIHKLSTEVAELAVCTVVKAKAYMSSEIGLLALVAYIVVFLHIMVNKMQTIEKHESVAVVNSMLGVEDTITSPEDMAQWLTNIVGEVWAIQACGDNICDMPLEFKSFAHLGCTYDCGREEELYSVLLVLQGDFSKSPMGDTHTSTLKSTAQWNLCWADQARVEAGIGEVCWYEDDQVLDMKTQRVAETHRFALPIGQWFVRISGDYYHLLEGQVYFEHPDDPSVLKELSLDKPWLSCEVEVSKRNQNIG